MTEAKYKEQQQEKSILRYFRQLIADTKVTGLVDHMRNKIEKYLNSDRVSDSIKRKIMALFTESEAGKKKIMTKETLMNDKVFKVQIKKKFVECDSRGKRLYKDQIVIDNKYIKVTEALVRG